ncbi:MAG: hypothetical protein WBC44_17385 [Planctomycetaceae bacterium]
MPAPCIRCRSEKIIPDVPIQDSFGDTGSFHREAAVHIHGEPQAWFFKETAIGQLRADICGECGHVELRIDNFRELYESYLKSGLV